MQYAWKTVCTEDSLFLSGESLHVRSYSIDDLYS
jgi:hypothetical protein